MRIKMTMRFLVAGIFLLFSSTGAVWAGDCDLLTSCTTPGGWTVTLPQIMLDDDGIPVLDDNGDQIPIENPKPIIPCNQTFIDEIGDEVTPDECFLWTYRVAGPDGTTSKLNHVNFTFPVNCESATLMKSVEGGMHLYPAGAGDDTTSYGENIFEISIGKFTPNNTTQRWSFYSTEGRASDASVGLKVGKDFEACAIAGPSHYGSDPSEVFTFTAYEELETSDNKKFRFVRDPVSRCITYAEKWAMNPDTNEFEWIVMEKVPIGQVLKSYDPGSGEFTDFEFGGNINQMCYEAYVKSKGDRTWFFINNRWVWK
jgi:hypothetical protein